MRLKSILIICLFSLFKQKTFEKYGQLKKDSSLSINYTNYCVYIELQEFKWFNDIKIKITVKNGIFDENILYFLWYNLSPAEQNIFQINNFIKNDSYSSGNYNGKYYDYYILYYTIKKNSDYSYLFIGIPQFSEPNSYVEIECSASGISIYIIIIICLVAVIFTISIIIIIIYIKARKLKKNENNELSPEGEPPNNPNYTPAVLPIYSLRKDYTYASSSTKPKNQTFY